ncbi:hypothetical protein PFNF135_00162 [Plasmodium falciparum NF135/5.C10]|uniref:Surface antigen n=1 Tax=Plasmodium falciparum NF135/5.C10 TaxID=1036726 RepID=W4IQ33_PLAFA|nr:hypothetical protein PFNF135_00162 [Plasmodium falciparum NF135/5.C10]
MNIYYVEMLLFTFLINTLIFTHYENFVNNHYNINLIRNNTQRRTIKPRLLAQTQNHNPHYHNDPELKQMIDKWNKEAIKKYQKNHDPYEQLKQVVEKNGNKIGGGHTAEPMSTIEKDLLDTYKEMFGENSHILKSGLYTKDDNGSDKSSTCECTDTNNMKLATTKGKDNYLVNLKERCKGGIGFCSVGSVLITLIGLIAAKAAAFSAIASYGAPYNTCIASSPVFYIFDSGSLTAALKATSTCASAAGGDVITPAVGAAIGTFPPYGIAALVLLILVVVLIILYIWLYRRRKKSWKHGCKKHLCK